MIYHGDCLSVLRGMADNSLDACVTDPPYGLSFMGKGWDYDVPSVDIWREVFRVLKPGAHLLAFAGTRTQHRMAVNIEDAGFQIRDMIAWVYGSGFPKSHNLDGEWQGWGTALKPALEPITVARKPLIGTVAANVQTHGTGAINIDGCRVGTGEDKGVWPITQRRHNDVAWTVQPVETDTTKGRWPANLIHDGSEEVLAGFPDAKGAVSNGRKGVDGACFGHYGAVEQKPGYADSGSAARFFKTCKWSDDDWHHQSNNAQPVNAAESPSPECETPIVHGHAETRNSGSKNEASLAIPASTGNYNGSTRPPNHAPDAETPGNTDTIQTMTSPSSSSGCAPHATDANTNLENAGKVEGVNVQVQGMRFVYNAKASKSDRDEGNNHPTVKPTDLMRYLCRLVTPPGGTVLDPFMGSGSTGKAATLEGFAFVGIEREAEYLEIAKARIEHVQSKPRQEAML